MTATLGPAASVTPPPPAPPRAPAARPAPTIVPSPSTWGPGRTARAVVLSVLATVTTALTMAPLLEGSAWLPPMLVVLTAVGLAGAAAALARAPGIVVLLASALAGLIVTTALFSPTRAMAGGFVPTPASVGDLALLVADGFEVSRTAAAPAPVGPPLQALLAVSMTGVALAVIALAAWARHPGVAGLPLLLVACLPAALAPGGIGVGPFLVAGAGFLLLCLTDADQRVRAWGPLLRRRSAAAGSSGPVVASFVPAAATSAVLALVAAVLVPSLIPGLENDNLTEAVQDAFGEGGVQRVETVNPYLYLQRDLTQPEDTEVITYSTQDTTPDPLRIVTTDVFNGTDWKPSQPELPVDQTVDGPLPPPPGASPGVLAASARLVTDISVVSSFGQKYLPLPYPAASVDIEGTWLYDPQTLNVLSGTDDTRGKRYVVESYDINPDPQVLRDAPPAPAAIQDQYAALPSGTPDLVVQTAAQVTQGTTNAYDAAVVLQRYFRTDGGFTYTTDAPSKGGLTVMEAFLTDKRGYCVQFSSTMAIMARSLGIPARVAVGFLPGDQTAPGVYSVSIRDAHAWPELYFEGVGWVRFEPTPGSRSGASPSWSDPEQEEAAPSAAPSAQPSTSSSAQAAPAQPRPLREIADEPQGGAAGGIVSRILIAVAAAAAILLVLASVRAWRWARDAVRWRRAGTDPRRLADAAWLTMTERMADRGWRWLPGTVREQAAALVAAWEPDARSREALGRLVTAAERAHFSPSPVPADELRTDVSTVLRGTDGELGRWVRLRARWLPSPRPAGTDVRRSSPAAVTGGSRRG